MVCNFFEQSKLEKQTAAAASIAKETKETLQVVVQTIGSNSETVETLQALGSSTGIVNSKLSAALVHPVPIVAPQPGPGKPCLQSCRLYVSEQSLGLSKTLTKKLNCLFRDIGAPENPVPTRAICDLYDQVRHDAVALLSLQSTIAKKEKDLAALRAQTSNIIPHKGNFKMTLFQEII